MGATYKLKRKLADGTLEDVVLQGAGGGGSGSGSAEPFIVTFTNDGNDNYTVDVTYDDIEQAFADGKIVIGKDATDSYIYQIFGLNDDDTIPFSRIVNWGENGAVVETLFVNTDDSVSYARNTLGSGSSSGGGQPLYRHCIKVYEAGSDTYEIFLQIVSTSASPINTEEQLIAALGEGEHPCICSGTFNLDGSSYRACAIFGYDGDGEYHIYTDVNLEGYHIPLFGDRYYALSITDTVNLIGTASVSGSGGVAQLQQSVTHAELKALRDNGELVAGMQYRITDFVTTTSQSDTQSAGHPFDIIVTALSNNTLSENASVDLPTTSIANADGSLAQGSVQSYYYVFEDFTEGSDGTVEDYKATDEFIAYDYLENGDGVVVPVIYKTDAEGAIDAPEEYGEPDYEDIFYYDGTMEVDGVTYDKWRKICETQENGPFWDGRTGYIWALTNVIVKDGQIGGSVTDTYFANSNLPAWEIKYCLDNDITRFAWAETGGYWVLTDLEGRVYILDEKITVGEQEFFKTTHGKVLAIVEEPNTEQEIYYYDGETAVTFEEHRDIVKDYGRSEPGKGVIYYMKDEWGNECPYDFKNIQFIRYAVTATSNDATGRAHMKYNQGSQDIKYAHTSSMAYWTVDSENSSYYYTFSYVLTTGTVQDLSIIGNKLSPDYEDTCVQNKIGAYYPRYGRGDAKLYLNNNVLVGTEVWYVNNDSKLTCSYNTFGDNCIRNTFGNNCCDNTFGNNCCDNTFADDCHSNRFDNDCHSNTFGDNCKGNTFGNGCYYNVFSHECRHNTFGPECTFNDFRHFCRYNTFGIQSSSNNFMYNCNYNTFGNECHHNTLSQFTLYNIFENGVQYVELTSTTQGNGNNYLQNITVSQGIKGTSSSNRKTINATRNLAYKTTYVAQGSVTTEV